jgi:DivIVA domain-containing protein
MEWFIAVIAVAALGVAAMGQMSKDPVHDTYRQDLPQRPLGPEDIRQLRFGVTMRGYAMAQVDDVLERLAREIAEKDATIDALTAGDTQPIVPAARRIASEPFDSESLPNS